MSWSPSLAILDLRKGTSSKPKGMFCQQLSFWLGSPLFTRFTGSLVGLAANIQAPLNKNRLLLPVPKDHVRVLHLTVFNLPNPFLTPGSAQPTGIALHEAIWDTSDSILPNSNWLGWSPHFRDEERSCSPLQTMYIVPTSPQQCSDQCYEHHIKQKFKLACNLPVM